jgi:predicted enzyme related to lactoylglutathione lyase
LKIRWTALTALAMLVAVGCTTSGVSLPALTETPTGTHQVGRIVWRDLITDRPAESRRFYEALFGWQFEPVGNLLQLGGSDAYTLIRHNGRLIGGMVDQAALRGGEGRGPEASQVSQWVSLMSVDDLDAAVERFADGGGTILTPPTDVADRGRMAVAVDPQGALLALVQTASGDPEIRRPSYGDFLWDELWTSDVAASSTFYRRFAGLGSRDVSLGEQSSYRVLAHQGQPTAGILAHPFTGERPVWVSYVRVADPAELTARVEALGGRVYVPAQDRALGGQVALIADPSGAGIALQSWTFADEEEDS